MSEYRYREKSKVQAVGSFNIQRFGKGESSRSDGERGGEGELLMIVRNIVLLMTINSEVTLSTDTDSSCIY